MIFPTTEFTAHLLVKFLSDMTNYSESRKDHYWQYQGLKYDFKVKVGGTGN